MTTRTPRQTTMFDEPPVTPPVRHAAEKEPPAAAEGLSVAESAVDGDVGVAPVWDWLSSYVEGKR